MNWHIEPDRPVYLQLIEQMQNAIVSGAFLPGQRLPSVRDMAAQAAVNPNTMMRALAELENQGLIITQRTAGKSITADCEKVKQLQEELAISQANIFLKKMKTMGYSKVSLIALLEKLEEEI